MVEAKIVTACFVVLNVCRGNNGQLYGKGGRYEGLKGSSISIRHLDC